MCVFFFVRGGEEGGGSALFVCEEAEDLNSRAWEKRGVSAALFRCFQMHGDGVSLRLVHLDQT